MQHIGDRHTIYRACPRKGRNIVDTTHPTGCDHWYVHRATNSGDQIDVEAFAGPLLIYRGDQDLACTELHCLSRPVHDIPATVVAAIIG